MNTYFAKLFAAFLLLASSVVNAATVTVGDYGVVIAGLPGDTGVDYIIGQDELVHDCSLSLSNLTCTLGIILDPDESVLFRVTAPAEFGLYAMVTTGPDFGGDVILLPNDYSTVYAGTWFDFGFDGLYAQGETQYLSYSIDGVPEAMTYFETHTEYSLPLPPTSSVPVPAAAWLFGSGLLGLVAVARRRNDEGKPSAMEDNLPLAA